MFWSFFWNSYIAWIQSITCQIYSQGFKECILLLHFSERSNLMTKHFISNHVITFQILSSGICGTDLHILEGRNKVPLPAVLGHEGAGIVESVGEGVTSVKPGNWTRYGVNPVKSPFLTHSLTFPQTTWKSQTHYIVTKIFKCNHITYIKNSQPKIQNLQNVCLSEKKSNKKKFSPLISIEIVSSLPISN